MKHTGNNTFEDFQKWKETLNAKKFEQAFSKQLQEKQKRNFTKELTFNHKDLQKPQYLNQPLPTDGNQILDSFNQQTLPLPLRGGGQLAKKTDPKDLVEKLTDPFEESNKKREKFAGMIGDSIWKYNPNSEYNKFNDKRPGFKEEYQDQRQYYLHRKNLAENIEKARREDPSKAKEKEAAAEREKKAEALRAEKRKEYLALKKARKLKQQQEEEDGVLLRDSRQRVVNFELTALDEFSVTTNFVMPEEIVNILKKFGAFYNKKHKEWTVKSLFKYKEVAMDVVCYCKSRGIEVDLIPQIVFDTQEFPIPFTDPLKLNIVGYDYSEDLTTKPMISALPKSLSNSLYNFQKVGVQFGLDHYGRCLIGDEMGVGKTIQAISIAYLFSKKDWPLLIITPSSLRFTWRDEIMNWLKFIREEDIQVFTSSQDAFNSACSIYIISYNIATRLSGLIDRKKFCVAIADEAHYLKSRDSKRARSLVPVLMKIKRVLLLSGTPILARPNEIYNQLRILRPDIFYSFKEFGLRYCNPKESYFGIDWTGSSNMRELHLMIGNSIMIRRLKSEVLTELPAKRRQRISISTDSNQVKKIHYMLKKVKNWQDKIGRRGENAFGAIQNDFEEFIKQYGNNMMQDATFSSLDDKYSYLVNAYGLTGTAKIKGILEFVETLLENRCKFLIFAHHYDVLDAIEEAVIKKKISHIRIDGKIEQTKRYEAVRKFQTDSECLVAVLSLTASCTGITLTAASTVVFAEMNWTPGIMVQAEDRAHRIGQVSSVNVYYLFGENTLDAMIYPRLKLKSEVFANVVDGKGTDFKIDCEDEARKQIQKRIEEKRNNGKITQKFEKISNQIQHAQTQGTLIDQTHQTNISDFFFVKHKSQSTIKSHKKNQNNLDLQVDNSTNLDTNDQHDISIGGESRSMVSLGPSHILEQVERSQNPNHTNYSDSEDEDYEEFSFAQHNFDIEGPLPEPPLASLGFTESCKLIDIYQENWEEGIDTKQKAYQKLRGDKNKMFEENKIWKKFTSIFKGLKRCHTRAKKPNKITEYEVPRDPSKFNKKIEDFDPALLFEIEYAKDDEKKKKREEALYGPRPAKEEVQIIKVSHLSNLKQEDRVLSIYEELSQLEYDKDFKRMKKEETSQMNQSESGVQELPNIKETNFKEDLQKKKISDMLRNMQEYDNPKLKGVRDDDRVIFLCESMEEQLNIE